MPRSSRGMTLPVCREPFDKNALPSKQKCEAANAVEALDPGVPYESRWAPYVRIHGPGQGQFPKGSIRPRGYMAPDARRSLAGVNVATMGARRQRRGWVIPPSNSDFQTATRL